MNMIKEKLMLSILNILPKKLIIEKLRDECNNYLENDSSENFERLKAGNLALSLKIEVEEKSPEGVAKILDEFMEQQQVWEATKQAFNGESENTEKNNL